jgi:carboxyl-terminal processing protease
MHRSAFLFPLALLVQCAAAQQQPERLTEEQRQRNLESFELVWSTVRDRHFDPKQIGEMWDKARATALPRVQAAPTMDAFRAAVRGMLRELGQSHFGIVPARAYRHVAPGGASQGDRAAAQSDDNDDFVTGIQPGVVDGRGIVVEVIADSPAAKAGIRMGWWIEAVDGASVQDELAPLEAADAHQKIRLGMRIVESLLEGRMGEVAKVELVDGEGKRVTADLARIEPRGKLVQFGNVPPERVSFESKRVADNIAYIRFNMFGDPERLMPEFERAVLACMECKGFIVDLRGNPGGLGPMAMGMAGWFVRRGRQRLGVMRAPGMTMPFEINPRARTFNGPLALLIDEGSASTSEILAAGLRDLGCARLFGARTAGAALPSAFLRLPNGDGLQYAVASYVSQNGKALEGAGVEPDVAVSHTREALLEGHDRVVDAAVHWIHAQ